MMILRPTLALAAATALVGSSMAASTGTARATDDSGSTGAPTSSSMSDTSATQQRWLSVPQSRVVLNPYASEADTELEGSSGTDLPLATGFYAWDKAVKTSDVLMTFLHKDGTASASAESSSDEQSGGSVADIPAGAVWSDDFADSSQWTMQSDDLSLTPSDDGATLALANADHDHRYMESTPVTINLDENPYLTIDVGATTGKWSLKVNDGNEDIALQYDTTLSGTLLYDIPTTTSWSGTKTFTLKLFEIGPGTHTSLRDISIHSSGSSALTRADSVDYTWEPDSLSMTGHYGDASVSTRETFDSQNVNSFSRTVEASNLPDGTSPVVAGSFEGDATTVDPQTNTITIGGEHATRTIALPEGSTPTFYATKTAMELGVGGSAEPASSSGYWSAPLPEVGPTSIGVGWAINAKDDPLSPADADGPGVSRSGALDAASRAEDSLSHWQSSWDSYLATVPVVEDFSVQRVPDGGVTSDQMRHFYYMAWTDLEMNVLPATPETGNAYLQVGTGKPSLWMNGTPGTRNVASWDSLLGIQQLVYTDPSASWDSYIGMMKSVSLTDVQPTDTNGVGTDAEPVRGSLKGESLPSRKAQTGWILYSATGDTDKLASIYDNLQANLIWSSHNMRWILNATDNIDERDSEFVASLIYDLKFGVRIATLLGHNDDAAQFTQMISDLTSKYEQWFFPTHVVDATGTDVTGKWPSSTIQKVFLNSIGTCPSSDPTEGQDEFGDVFNDAGQCVKAGWSFYTTTALVADQLSDQARERVMERFMDDYDDQEQLAGLGHFAVKAPDIQLITYGLLDSTAIGGSNQPSTETTSSGESTAAQSTEAALPTAYSQADLRDMAAVIVNSFTRDVVKSGWFAEVYYSTGTHQAGGTPGARGVRPSLFGISNYIDSMWMANGYRVDEGTPTVVRLTGATGGVSGLSYLGQSLNIDLAGQGATLSGDAVGHDGGLTDRVELPDVGASVQVPLWSPGTDPDDPDDNGGGSGDVTPPPTPEPSNEAPSASPSSPGSPGGLAHTGAASIVMAAALFTCLAGAAGLTIRRRMRRN